MTMATVIHDDGKMLILMTSTKHDDDNKDGSQQIQRAYSSGQENGDNHVNNFIMAIVMISKHGDDRTHDKPLWL